MAGQVKMDVCHIPPENPEITHTVAISENAVGAHPDHGDRRVPGEVGRRQGARRNERRLTHPQAPGVVRKSRFYQVPPHITCNMMNRPGQTGLES